LIEPVSDPRGQPVRILKQKSGEKDSTDEAGVTEKGGHFKSEDKKTDSKVLNGVGE
jgi:hypothetical protein